MRPVVVAPVRRHRRGASQPEGLVQAVRPASASGRRPHAKVVAYQPSSGCSVTPAPRGVHEPAVADVDAGVDRSRSASTAGPCSPKKTRSPGWRSAIAMRCATGTSPLISYVVRPRSRRRGSRARRRTASACRPARRSRSSRSRRGRSAARCRPSSTAAAAARTCPSRRTGRPTNWTARASTVRCQSVSAGGANVPARAGRSARPSPSRSASEPGQRVRRLGTRAPGRSRPRSSVVLAEGVVEAQAREPGDRLRAEPRRRLETRVARGEADPPGGGRQAERADEACVELRASSDDARRVGRRLRPRARAPAGVDELALR